MRSAGEDSEEPVALSATEELSDGDVVFDIPLKLTLSQLTHSKAKNNEQLRKIFDHNQEWGLACYLLTGTYFAC